MVDDLTQPRQLRAVVNVGERGIGLIGEGAVKNYRGVSLQLSTGLALL